MGKKIERVSFYILSPEILQKSQEWDWENKCPGNYCDDFEAWVPNKEGTLPRLYQQDPSQFNYDPFPKKGVCGNWLMDHDRFYRFGDQGDAGGSGGIRQREKK